MRKIKIVKCREPFSCVEYKMYICSQCKQVFGASSNDKKCPNFKCMIKNTIAASNCVSNNR